MQELMDYLNEDSFDGICDIRDRVEELLEKEKEQMIDFYNWMRRNDSSEEYFHYSDEDMLEQYLTKTNNLCGIKLDKNYLLGH